MTSRFGKSRLAWLIVVVLAAGAAGFVLVRALSDEPAPVEPARYETLDKIADAIGCTDLADVGTGGNPGLRAFGVCLIGRHNIDLYLTSDPGWNYLAEQFASVIGPDWIVVCPTGAEAARLVHDKIGGRLEIPPSPSPTDVDS